MTTSNVKCPVCDSLMGSLDLPKQNVYICKVCEELVQVLPDGTLLTITNLLERVALGDDRARSAISRPQVATVKNALDLFENATRQWRMEMGVLATDLRAAATRAENRLDYAMRALAGLDLALPGIGEALAAIREARNTFSTLPPASRGLTKDTDHDHPDPVHREAVG